MLLAAFPLVFADRAPGTGDVTALAAALDLEPVAEPPPG